MRWYSGLPIRTGSSLLPVHYSRPGFFDTGFAAVTPFQWLRQMEREMDRMFASFFEGPRAAGWEPFPAQSWTPSIDVQETADQWALRAELPGIKPEHIEVTTTGNLLTLRAQESHEQDEPQDGSTRYYCSYHQSFPLPPTVQAEAVTAEYRNGVLEIHLPKTEAAKQQFRRVPIGNGAAAIEGEVTQEALASAKGGEVSSPAAEKAPRKSRRSRKAG
jgi:HSP20 family protein